MTRAGAASPDAALPRHLPRGLRPALDELSGLRRYGAGMRSLLALDDEPRVGARTPPSRSQGMDYAESRPYSPGDDVRRIDWRVTARTGRAHTKLYRLESGYDVICLLDLRPTMHFGTRAALKSVVAAQLAVLAGWAAAAGGNRFGAFVAGAQGTNIPPGAAEDTTATLCHALAAASLEAPQADATVEAATLDQCALRAVAEADTGARFVIVSDFSDADAVLARALKLLRARGNLVLIWILDAMEACLPPPGRYPLTDGRDYVVLDTGAAGVRTAHQRELAARRERLARHAALPGTRCHAVQTGEELFAALARPFIAS